MIECVIKATPHDLGGFTVGRVLPYAPHRKVGPFVFFDHFGPASFAPGLPRDADVRPHPHIGLSTLTYLFEGEITHRDSMGSEVEIRPGEVNWMTAGSGVTHSERFETLRRRGGALHGIQAWIALPTGAEEIDPAFVHFEANALPAFDGDGLCARIVAGEAFGVKAPAKTHSPLFYVHLRLAAGARAQVPAAHAERAAFVASGAIEIGGRTFEAGEMVVFSSGAEVVATAPREAQVMLLGGDPIGERFVEWNFVSSSKARIDQAKADWRAGRMKLPDLDHDEFIPLPPDPAPPASPLS